MTRFQPFLGMFLLIGSTYFEFVPHPLLPRSKDTVYVLEGGEALVYQIREVDTKALYALKVFKPAYQGEHIARVHGFLAQHADVPGFHSSQRVCITMANYPALVRTFPEVEYAILMPWIDAQGWTGFLLDQAASAQYTFVDARDLALATANILWNIEARGLAHTDIAGSNVLLLQNRKQIQLLDIDSLYVPGHRPPKRVSQGSPGYQHRRLGLYGQWCPEGDRFAGAMLLTEMLTWWDPRVRAHVPDHAETLFRPQDLQVAGPACWQAVRNTLYSISANLLALFDQAWASASLAECPTLATWAITVLSDFS